jgi:flagellin
MSANTARQLRTHYSSLAGSAERISSGLRVNKSADDAAGLSIRELMRAEIAGLHQGIRNVNDAISLIQTADGALQIVDEKLIRMKELTEQAATGTYNSDQRLIIDSEYQQMAREMTRIGMATTFNGITLLNGNLEAEHDGTRLGGRNGSPGSLDGIMFGGMLKIHFGTGNDPAEDYYYIQIFDTTNMYLNLGDQFSPEQMATPEMTRPFLLGVESSLKSRILSGKTSLTPEEIAAGYILQSEYDATLQASMTASEAFINEAAHGFGNAASFMDAFNETFGAGILPRDTSFIGPENLHYAYLDGMSTANPADMYAAYNALTGDEKEKYQFAFMRNSIKNLGDRLSDGSIFTNPAGNPGGVDFFSAVDPRLRDVIARSGIGAVNQFHYLHTYAGRNIRTQENAQHALAAVDRAMLKKDSNRAHLGALQNRLENTISNLQIQAENTQSAESRISDADVAVEMTAFVRSQILAQAATAMLAQTNYLPGNIAMDLISG